MCGSVVRTDDEYGVLPHSQLLELLDELSHLPVYVSHHRGIAGVRIAVRQIGARVGARLLVAQLVHIVLNLFGRGLHGTVRHRRRPHHEERSGGILSHELLYLFVHQVAAVLPAPVALVACRIQRVHPLRQLAALHHQRIVYAHPLPVLPELGRVIGMGQGLAVETVEIVEAHRVGH